MAHSAPLALDLQTSHFSAQDSALDPTSLIPKPFRGVFEGPGSWFPKGEWLVALKLPPHPLQIVDVELASFLGKQFPATPIKLFLFL